MHNSALCSYCLQQAAMMSTNSHPMYCMLYNSSLAIVILFRIVFIKQVLVALMLATYYTVFNSTVSICYGVKVSSTNNMYSISF